jgi:hypothetical protein
MAVARGIMETIGGLMSGAMGANNDYHLEPSLEPANDGDSSNPKE